MAKEKIEDGGGGTGEMQDEKEQEVDELLAEGNIDDAAADDDDDDDDDDENDDDDVSNSDVCTKYREAAKIVDVALQGLIMQAVPGSKILDLCKFGDNVIMQKCAMVYAKKVKGKFIEKGIAFPTCVSVNECVCHNSPLESDKDEALANGDMVKIDVGSYIDGYIAVAAHTFVVGTQATPENPITGLRADVLMATHIASEVATKMLRPGNTNSQITNAISQVADAFGVRSVAGVLSHRMKRFVIDGNKVILLREDVDQKVENQTIKLNEVYSIDIAMSSGEGKPREAEARTTVFKRAVDKNYRLKMRASRYLFNEVNQKYPALPFALRSLPDERQARMGVVELLKHELLHAYPVLYERASDQVVHFKFTVLVLANGPTRISGLPSFAVGSVVSSKVIPDEVSKILSTASKKKKKKKTPKNRRLEEQDGSEEK